MFQRHCKCFKHVANVQNTFIIFKILCLVTLPDRNRLRFKCLPGISYYENSYVAASDSCNMLVMLSKLSD